MEDNNSWENTPTSLPAITLSPSQNFAPLFKIPHIPTLTHTHTHIHTKSHIIHSYIITYKYPTIIYTINISYIIILTF